MTNDAIPSDQTDRLRRALLAIDRLQKKVDRLHAQRAERMPIAIIGMGCRFPGADSPEALWRLLSEGRDAVREVPPDRWDIDAYYDPDPTAAGKMYTRVGGFLERVDGFDAAFFGIAPREALSMDPQQRLLLEVAWEALENAGLPPDRLAGSATGVFLGIFSNDYYHLQMLAGNDAIDAYTGTGNTASVAAGRLSYLLGLEGPNLALDTACSSSLVAVHLAMQSLRAGESDLALAGGVNLILAPDRTIYFCKLRAMAPDGQCKTFDARADGYVRGEGCGIVVLKRLDDAVRDGDPIVAVIRGSAVNQDGRSSGLTAPNGPAQTAAIRKALAEAQLEPGRISYVEAHGTGTALGDPIEAGALTAALSPGRAASNPLAVGSIKTNMGHLEAAAGVAALIKVALMLQHKQIPPNLHFETPSPLIDWTALPIQVPTRLLDWPAAPGERRLAGVNSFGLSGTNAHVILEEAPEALRAGIDHGPYLLPLSARTEAGLRSVAQGYQAWLHSPAASLYDVCYSAGARRSHYEHRLGVVGGDREMLSAQLGAFLGDSSPRRPLVGYVPRGPRPKVAFVFAGQGGQWAGMGRELLASEPVFAAALDECSQALQPYLARPLRELLADEQAAWLGQIDQLQPVLFALQVALAAQWRAWGILPDAVVGHSLGEVAAAHVAGALSLPEAARVIGLRSQLLGRLRGQGTMVMVELPAAAAEAALAGLGERAALAAVNGPRSSVLAGEAAALAGVVAKLEGQGVFCRWVAVDVAAHSPQVEPLQAELAAGLAGLRPAAAGVPFYTTVSGAGERPVLDGAYWVRNLRAPVRFWEALQRLAADGHTVFLELSPHPTLKHAIEETLQQAGQQGAAVASLSRDSNETLALHAAAGALYTLGQPIAWEQLYPGGGLVDLPAYPWQRERFWFADNLAAASAPPPGRSGSAAGSEPLPGRRLSSPLSEAQFETRLRAEAPDYLADHRLMDTVIVPGAWYAAAALAAAERTLGSGDYQLEDVFFPEVMVLGKASNELLDGPADLTPRPPSLNGKGVPGDRADAARQSTLYPALSAERRVQTILARDMDGGATFRVLSCGETATAESEAWTLHADGRARRAEAGAAQRMNLIELRARCDHAVTSEEFYDRMWQRGYHFGPSLRTIGALWQGDGEVLCEVSAQARDRDALRVQLIDCCLQLPAAMARADALEDIYLPVGFDQLRFSEPANERLWGYAALRKERPAGDEPVFDVTLLTENGEVVAALTGLQSKRADAEALAAARAQEPEMYAVAWRPTARTDGRRSNQRAAGTWLLLADQNGTAAGLADWLRAQGEHCLLVYAGSASESADVNGARVDPARWDDMTARLKDLIAANGPMRGVVYCWGLDAGSQTDLDVIQPLVGDGVLAVVAALVEDEAAPAPRLWLVTRGAQAIAGEMVTVGQAPLWGLGRTIAYEHPELRCTLIDLDPGADAAATLGAELLGDSAEDQLAVRQAGRYAARLERAPSTLSTAARRFDSTYLITGGLGALGLHVADWLVKQGARQLALLGRSAPSAAAQQAVDGLRRRGARVLLLQADVADLNQLEAALDKVRQALPPLGGVVHAAGVLDDGLLLQLTPERLRRVLAPKAAGAWNLHSLTRSDPIETFVMFASASGLLGAPGQANYAAANAFLDALAHYRRALGLPALSIDWGPWAEVGLAAAQSNRGQRLALRGVAGLSTEAGLNALGRALAIDMPQVGIMRFDLRQWQQYYPGSAGSSFLAGLALPEPAPAPRHVEHLREQLLGVPIGPGRRLRLEDFLVEQICRVLRLNAAQFDRRKPLGDFGFDSLMALELRNVLEASLGVPLSATLIWRYASLSALTDHLAEKLGLALEEPVSTPVEQHDALERVAIEIADLSDVEMEALLLQQIDRLSKTP